MSSLNLSSLWRSIMETHASDPTSATNRNATPNFSIPLDRDLLWQIFLINADMEQESEEKIPAISTLRHISQVCSAWRDLVVNSPSLWGRVINFDWLRQEDWRKEVLRRTRSSKLSLRGGINGRGLLDIEDIVVSVISENWSRVRSLNLLFDEHNRKMKAFKHDGDFWRVLERSSDVLESFVLSIEIGVRIGGVVKNILSPPNFTVFNNHAPSLRTFIAPNVRFNLQATWTSGIRSLALNTPSPVHELLEALTHMPLLEILQDHGLGAITHGDPKRKQNIALPRLKHIIFDITSDIAPYLAFLASIEPSHGRLLSFICHSRFYINYIPDAQAAVVASPILSTYPKYAGLEASTEINLVVRPGIFSFSARLPCGKSFTFNVEYTDNPLERASVELWRALILPEFSQAHALRLDFQENLGVVPSDPKFINFISSVRFVPVLETTPKTLQFLLRLPAESRKNAFPLLYRLILNDWFEPQADLEALHAFLAFRTSLGITPNSVFIHAGRDEVDVKALEEFKGLRVMVDHHGTAFREYVCKGRQPEELLLEEMD